MRTVRRLNAENKKRWKNKK